MTQPADNENGGMMKPVKENNFLLLEHQEYRVYELRYLTVHKQREPEEEISIIHDVLYLA